VNRDVTVITGDLAKCVAEAAKIQRELEDLHSLAYDRHVSGGEVASGTRLTYYLDEVGSSKAKALWKRLERNVHDAMVRLTSTSTAIHNLLCEGPGVDEDLRGSMISEAEFDEALSRQRAARRRGEFVPRRNPGVEQPAYPSSKPPQGECACSHCGQLGARAKSLCSACYGYERKYKRLPSSEVLEARSKR
jgi:hypothetical protein